MPARLICNKARDNYVYIQHFRYPLIHSNPKTQLATLLHHFHSTQGNLLSRLLNIAIQPDVFYKHNSPCDANMKNLYLGNKNLKIDYDNESMY